MKTFAAIGTLLIIFGGFACKETPPEPTPYVPTIFLSAEDVGVTDAWLKITRDTPHPTQDIVLKRDGQTVFSDLRLLTSDTLLIDTSLLPNRTYTYKAYRLTSDTPTDSSASVSVTTLDSTSHNFQFETFVLGDGNSSVLYDVAIINDTLVYAVGEISVKDSLGNWINPPYNIAKWNGQEWELKRVTVMFRGNFITPELYGIYAFSATDIWLAAGMAIHGDGQNWVGHDVRAITGYDTLSFTKCWGQSSSDMYFVGLRGSLAHYSSGPNGGGTWRRVESGTSTNINDVWGVNEDDTNNEVVYCAVSSFFNPGDQKILKLTDGGNKIDSISWGTGRNVFSVWSSNGRVLYACGSGVFENKHGYWHEAPLPSIYTNNIRGISLADIFVVGDFGLVAHYNGVNWRVFSEVEDAQYFALAMKNNLVVCVGQKNSKAVVLRGRRNQ